MIMAAVVLSIMTAFFVVSMDGTDGAVPSGFTEINESNYSEYTSSNAPKNIYVNMTDVPERAFENWTTVTKVTFSESVRTIGDYAFYGCTKLLTVTGESVEAIGEYAFANSGVASATFSTPLTTLGKGCFSDCSALQGPILTNTSVTVIGVEAFRNSGIVLEDLRNVTEIRQSAFRDTDMKAQILNENQTLALEGVPEVRLGNLSFEMIYHYKTDMTMKFMVPSSQDFMRLVCWSGDDDATVLYPVKTSGKYVFSVPYSTECIHIDALTYTIDYPESLGMADETRKCGDGTYTLKNPEGLGDLFSGWNVEGLSGKKTKLYEEDFMDLDTTVVLVPIMTSATITFDHSAVMDTSEYPGLQTSMQFSAGDTYPAMDNLADFNFLGWTVGEVNYNAGDEITIYSNHTATSRWENVRTYTVTLKGPDQTTITSFEKKNGTEIDLSSLTYEEALNETFVGWSTTNGGTAMTSNPTVNSDMSLYAVVSQRQQFTLTFMDGDDIIGTQNGYDGRTVVISVDDPASDGKMFQYWRLGDSVQKSKGDSVLMDGDATLEAVWTAVQLTLRYHIGSDTTSSTHDWGTGITIGIPVTVPANHTLSGWSTTSDGETSYLDGAVLSITTDLDLYPVITENAKFTVTCHSHTGSSSQVQIYAGQKYTIPPKTSDYPNHTFLGWSDTDGGQVKYETSAIITPNADMDLYEVWTENEKYVVRVHSETPIVKTAYEGESIEIEFPSMTRDNYELLGWTDISGSNVPRYSVGQKVVVSAAKEYYPAWKEIVVPSNNTGSSDNPGTSTSTPSEVPEDPSESETPQGTTGTGTNPTKSGTSLSGRTTSRPVTAPTTTVPVTEPDPVDPPKEITYHDGETVTTAVCNEDGEIELQTLEKEGYRFLGWTLKDSEQILPSSYTVTSDTEVYAKWEAIPASTDSDAKETPDKIAEPDRSTPPTSGGGLGLDNTAMTAVIGAAIAALVSVVLVVQMRKN